MFNVLRAGAAIALISAAGAALSTASAAETELTVVEHPTNETVTDTGDKGDTAGDILTFANEIFDAGNVNAIGTDNGWCARTVPGKAWECVWTTRLKDGQITVEGPFLDDGDSIVAVTGGTGAYAGARGEMKLHARDAKAPGYDFVFSLR